MARQIVVTGGSSGIGYAIAERFARDGDKVTITGRDSEKLAAAADRLGAHGVPCNATDIAQIEALAAGLERVDVLVNAVGANVTGQQAGDLPTLRETADVWRANFDVNLFSAVLTTTALMPRMEAGGTIIAIGSAAAEMAASSYGAAKAALSAWTAGFSAVVGPRGITVNSIVPSYTADTDFYATPLPQQLIESMINTADTRRAGTPADVAGIAHFLAGPAARNITAQALHVSGGAHRTR